MHIPKNITAAQKHAQDFHKGDTLAQTSQIKYDCFFLHGTENTQKIITQDLKLERKIWASFFTFYIVL